MYWLYVRVENDLLISREHSKRSVLHYLVHQLLFAYDVVIANPVIVWHNHPTFFQNLWLRFRMVNQQRSGNPLSCLTECCISISITAYVTDDNNMIFFHEMQWNISNLHLGLWHSDLPEKTREGEWFFSKMHQLNLKCMEISVCNLFFVLIIKF